MTHINVCLSEQEKAILLYASKINGFRTLNAFIFSASIKEAREILRIHKQKMTKTSTNYIKTSTGEVKQPLPVRDNDF